MLQITQWIFLLMSLKSTAKAMWKQTEETQSTLLTLINLALQQLVALILQKGGKVRIRTRYKMALIPIKG